MSLSSGPAGGKGVDSNAVDTYDSGDEWDIGVGNLIIDLDADLEKDKLEMSGSKEGGAMAAPPSAVAALPDNIKFVSPVAAASQGKESKSKSKRSKNSKDSVKAPASDGAKKEVQGRAPGEPPSPNPNSAPAKGAEKTSKPSRALPAVKKEKEGTGKTKKEKMEVVATGVVNAEKESGAPVLPLGAPRSCTFEGQQNPELAAAEQLGNIVLDSAGIGQPVAMTTEPDEVESGECRNLKKVGSEKVRGSGEDFFTCYKRSHPAGAHLCLLRLGAECLLRGSNPERCSIVLATGQCAVPSLFVHVLLMCRSASH